MHDHHILDAGSLFYLHALNERRMEPYPDPEYPLQPDAPDDIEETWVSSAKWRAVVDTRLVTMNWPTWVIPEELLVKEKDQHLSKEFSADSLHSLED